MSAGVWTNFHTVLWICDQSDTITKDIVAGAWCKKVRHVGIRRKLHKSCSFHLTKNYLPQHSELQIILQSAQNLRSTNLIISQLHRSI